MKPTRRSFLGWLGALFAGATSVASGRPALTADQRKQITDGVSAFYNRPNRKTMVSTGVCQCGATPEAFYERSWLGLQDCEGAGVAVCECGRVYNMVLSQHVISRPIVLTNHVLCRWVRTMPPVTWTMPSGDVWLLERSAIQATVKHQLVIEASAPPWDLIRKLVGRRSDRKILGNLPGRLCPMIPNFPSILGQPPILPQNPG